MARSQATTATVHPAPLPERVRAPTHPALPWIVGTVLGLIHWTGVMVNVLQSQLQRFDDGILYSSVALLNAGQVPFRDFYSPYGWGIGFIGLPAEWLFGGQALAIQAIYALAPALVTCLACVVGWRQLGPLGGIAFAIVVVTSDVYRYTLTWSTLFAFALLADEAIRRTATGTLRDAVDGGSLRLGAASAALGLAGAFRTEYVVLVAVWAIVLAFNADGWRPWLRAAAPGLLVGGLPYLVIAAAGGGAGMLRYADYVAFHFDAERGRPVTWPTFTGSQGYEPALVSWLYYGVSVAVLGYWAWRGVSWLRGRRDGDPSRLGVFSAVVCAIVLYAQVRTFSATQGALSIPVAWLAVVLLPGPRRVRLGFVLAAAVLVMTLPTVRTYWPVNGYREAKQGLSASWLAEPVPKLWHIPLSSTWPSLASLKALWEDRVRDRRYVFSINRRNDQTTGNEAFVYWFLGARTAAWPMAFDPGLADRDDVQHDVVDDLCKRRPPIVQHTQAYPLFANQPRDRPGSRYLDEFVALNYRVVGANDLFRVMLPEPGACVRPETVSSSALRRRRSELLAADDLPAAGALSVLAMRRDRGAAAQEDAAGAILGGYWVPNEALPPGPAGAGLRAFRDEQATTPATPVPAASGTPLLRLALITGYLAGRSGPLPGDRATLDAARRLARDRPNWPGALRTEFALQPYAPQIAASLARQGGEGPTLERWRFDGQRAAGDAGGALATARRLLPMLRDQPLEQGRVLTDLAATLDQTGDRGCAAAALAAADRIPGVHTPPPPGPRPCVVNLGLGR